MSDDKYKQIFSKNLRYYMSLNNKEQIDLINDLGLNKSAVSTWCNGTRLPRMDKVNMLAEYLGISRSDLIEARSSEDSVNKEHFQTKDERDLVLSYRKLNDRNKEKCSLYTNTLLTNQQMEEDLMPNAAHESTKPYTAEERQYAGLSPFYWTHNLLLLHWRC